MNCTALDLTTTHDHYIEDVKLKIAKKILAEVMHFRRTPKSSDLCNTQNCQRCALPHLSKIIVAVKNNEPVTFVLPGFPGKSPNLSKVLGHLPDYAEKLALRFLGKLCQQIKQYYLPGIKIILCSDGRVFSDIVGMQENHVTAYQIELDRLLLEMSLTDVTTFNLEDFYNSRDFSQMRDELMNQYGNSLAFIKQKIQAGKTSTANSDEKSANRMFCGIARFLFEDAIHPTQTKSRTTIQKESRVNAYEVIRRSNAWSALIAAYFPNAVRLSIHPQTCGSEKIGIRFIGDEIWMTPWHGVAVETKSGPILLKRSEAERLGATLIDDAFGRPSHYQLIER